MDRYEAIRIGKKYFIENPNEMVSLYAQLYSETICNECPGTIAEAWETIKRNLDRPISKYKIKPEYRKICNADGHWTNFNLTDEIAERLISEGYKNYFL